MRSISLPSLVICDQNVRFIKYSAENDYFTVSCTVEPEKDVLLFLGADVLSKCNQTPNHHSRIHSRYAKLGLATKITFKDVTIEGISNSTYLWFYSIMGLFRVVFEYLDVDVQQHCLQHLTELWLASVNHKTLPESTTLTLNEQMQDAGTDIPHNTGDTMAVDVLPVSVNDGDHSYNVPVTELQTETRSPHVVTYVAVMPVTISSPAVDAGIASVTDNITASMESENDEIDQLYCFVRSQLRCLGDDGRVDRRDRMATSLLVLLKLFCAEYQLAETEEDVDCEDGGNSSGFPFCLLEQYTELVCNKVDVCSPDGYDVDGRLGLFLHVVCDWLGSEFARLQPTIAERVERFKAANINRISNLPSPRHVVESLYPHCMTLLFLRWMDPPSADDSGDIPTDDSFGTESPQKRVAAGAGSMLGNSSDDHRYRTDESASESQLFPFIQLMLEFANGCLVSGIAHVLYPRLMHGQL